jgi:8-oxo-dGTP diphosphatase
MDGLIRISVCHLLHDGHGKYATHWRTSAARDEHERWDIGGGGVKFNESIIDAVKRELKEEYCADALDIHFLGWRDVFRNQDGKDTHWVTFDFKVDVDPAKVELGEPHKARDLRWVTIDEMLALDPQHSQLGVFLKKYKEKL